MDQLEGERGEEEKQREEWEGSQPGGQTPPSWSVSPEKIPTCQSLSKVAAVVSKGNTVQITRQILFCRVT